MILTSCPPGRCLISVKALWIISICLLPAEALRKEISSKINTWLVGCRVARVSSIFNKSFLFSILTAYGIFPKSWHRCPIVLAHSVFPVEGGPIILIFTTSRAIDRFSISLTAARIECIRIIFALFQVIVKGTSDFFFPLGSNFTYSTLLISHLLPHLDTVLLHQIVTHSQFCTFLFDFQFL